MVVLCGFPANSPVVEAVFHVLIVPGLVVTAVVIAVGMMRVVGRERHPGPVARCCPP